jgi:5'-nucleotidase (lipoprotein e(P4) family)
MKRALSLSPSLALALLAAACATSAPPATAPAPPPAPAMETAPAPRLPGALHWMRDAAEYRALLIQTYGAAGDRLEEIVGGLPPGTWAVSLDGDETVIDNSQYLKERALQGAGFTAESWAEWTTRQAAPPLPGALDFLHRVRELGGRIAIVTNRRASQCPDTEENFRKHEIPFDVILCAPDQGSTEKEPRWQRVEDGTAAAGLPPLDVVMWVGDNVGDFPDLEQTLREAATEEFAPFGDRYFVLPNPAYGSWERNPER